MLFNNQLLYISLKLHISFTYFEPRQVQEIIALFVTVDTSYGAQRFALSLQMTDNYIDYHRNLQPKLPFLLSSS